MKSLDEKQLNWLQSQGQLHLQGMLQVALATDGRAMTAMSVFTGIATAGVGVALALGLWVFGFVLAGGFYAAALCALINARSGGISYPGPWPNPYLQELKEAGVEYSQEDLVEGNLELIDRQLEYGRSVSLARKKWMDASWAFAGVTPLAAALASLASHVWA